MNTLLADTWERLAVEAPSGERLLARVALPAVTTRLQCGVDSMGKRHLLIRLDDAEAEHHDGESRGLTVQTKELVVRGQKPGRYLDVECGDPSGHSIFDVLASDLAADLARPNVQPADAVRRVLARWRRFWAHLPLPLLSREEQLGLLAEVWFLDVWLRPRIGAMDSLQRWHGPTGARHDFARATKAIEVKTTTSSRGRIYRINGLDQLEPPENGTLYLFGMRLQEDTGATNSLPALVNRVRGVLTTEPDALARFDTLLALAGYSAAYENEYDKLRVIVREERLFAVTDDFPRLTPADIPNAASRAIERVEYEINLNSFDHLSITNEQDIQRVFAT